MKFRQWIPVFLYLAGLYVCFGQLASAGHQLPPRIATSFNFSGYPISWMPTRTLTTTFALLALGLPLMTPGLLWFLRLASPKMANVPKGDYWQRPENWRRACDFLFFSSFWVVLAELLFVTGLFSLVVAANQHQPPTMPTGPVFALSGMLTVAILLWTACILWFFYRVPADVAT